MELYTYTILSYASTLLLGTSWYKSYDIRHTKGPEPKESFKASALIDRCFCVQESTEEKKKGKKKGKKQGEKGQKN
jgi:hypothetical protein